MISLDDVEDHCFHVGDLVRNIEYKQRSIVVLTFWPKGNPTSRRHVSRLQPRFIQTQCLRVCLHVCLRVCLSDHWQSMSAVWSQTKGLWVGGCVSSGCLYITVLVSDPQPSLSDPDHMILWARLACEMSSFVKKANLHILPNDTFCQLFAKGCVSLCLQHGWSLSPPQQALHLKGGSTDCSASRDICTPLACCGESPSRSPSTS